MAKKTEAAPDVPDEVPVDKPAEQVAVEPDKAPVAVTIPTPLPGQGIFAAMVGILRGFDAIKKGRQSTGYGGGYMFRGIDDVYNALHPLLGSNAVFPVATVVAHDQVERETKDGKLQIFTIMHMRYRFLTLDGSFVETEAVGEAQDMGDKSTNKAMSIAYKYACFQTFCIPTEDLVDPDATVPEPSVHPRNETNTARAKGKAPPERGRDGKGKVVDRAPATTAPTYDAAAKRTEIAKATSPAQIGDLEKDINKAGIAGMIDADTWAQLIFGLLSKAITFGSFEAVEKRMANYASRGMLSEDRVAVLQKGIADGRKAAAPAPEQPAQEGSGDADTQAPAQ